MHRFFLSHKHEDKPIVEPIALRLREIFGEEAVFYDAWSIRPGDGIIERMNVGLEAPDFVFFFVSKKSLASGLVSVEWQNALYKASKGETRLIPVRIDDVAMPSVLRQNLYVDVYAVGIEAGIAQLVNVIQGNSSFTPQHQGFSNLTWSAVLVAEDTVEMTILASHLMEPNPHFVILLDNTKDEADVSLFTREPALAGFYEQPFDLTAYGPDLTANGWTIAPICGAITPERPLKINIKRTSATPLKIVGVVHGWSGPRRFVPGKLAFQTPSG